MTSSTCGQRKETLMLMKDPVVGRALRERLGADATYELTDYVDRSGEHWRGDVIETCTDRLDARLQRIEESFTRVTGQMADMKVEILRWCFAFWVGQVLVQLFKG